MIIKTLTPEDAIRKNKELNSFSPKEDYIKAFKKELKKFSLVLQSTLDFSSCS